ncbi:hypothetical protein [Streptomyces sp. NPDC007856]|uniref:hypothetical protein n=1 Tax=Streptomyces sp. NPDC007856 TaxID=3364781 RepID=UPI00368DD4DA
MPYREDRADEDDPAGAQRGGGHGTGFGGGPLGGLFAPLADDTAGNTPTAAWSCGIRYFDMSPSYGIGHFEDALREGYPAPAELRAQGWAPSGPACTAHSTLDDLLSACVSRGVSVLAASIFHSGLLATPVPPRERPSTMPRPHPGACGRHGRSLACARHMV